VLAVYAVSVVVELTATKLEKGILKYMSKWQLTLIQNGKKLRKFGGTKHDVKWEADYMISCIQNGSLKGIPIELIRCCPHQFVISKYNNIHTKKKIIMEVCNFD
jgi:hypothetical protein